MTGGQMIKEPPRIADPTLFSYLQEMTRQVNFALAQVNEATVKVVEKAVSQEVSQSEKSQLARQAQEALKLRGLIEQTATEIYHTYDEIIRNLSSEYVAISEFGTYKENAERLITETAEGTLDQFEKTQTITSLKETQASFKEYRTTTSGYIRTGFLFEDTDPDTGQLIQRIGVAVGENFHVDIDGQTALDKNNLCATFTSNRLSFWQNGNEVAYFSNKKLYVQDVEYTNRLSVGKWEFKRDANDGLVIRYTGAAN